MAQQASSSEKSLFSPGIFLIGLTAAFGLWIITGALAYNNRNYPSANTRDAGIVFTITIVPLAFLIIVGNTLPEYERIASPPRKANSSAITAVLIFYVCTTIAYCIATGNKRSLIEHAFLILSSSYAGVILEAATGLVTGFLRRLEGAA